MVEYNCDKCGKKFDHKGNYKRHLIKQKPCKPIKKIDKPKKNKYQCKYCNKTYTRNDSLNRHQKSRCKVIKKNESEREQTFQYLAKKIEQLEIDNNKLKEDNIHLLSFINKIVFIIENNSIENL